MPAMRFFGSSSMPPRWKKCLESRELFARLGRAQETALTAVHIGHIQIEQNQLEVAEASISEGLHRAREIADVWSEMYGLTAWGYLLGKRGDLLAAFAAYSASLKIARQIGDRKQTGHILEYAGMSLEVGGRMEAAYAALRMAQNEFTALKLWDAEPLAARLEPLRLALGAEAEERVNARCDEFDAETLLAFLPDGSFAGEQ